MLYAEGLEYLASLGQDRIAVVKSDTRLERDLKAAAVARFDGDVDVGAYVFAVVTGFG
jgi:hypothetical protein